MDEGQTLTQRTTQSRSVPLWRDERVLRIIGQIVFLALLAAVFYFLFGNMFENLRRQGLRLGFGFLDTTAGFDIGEKMIPYARSDSYLRAFSVGLANTGLVSLLGIVFATLLGILFGVAELSTNFLVRSLARGYIELLRNIPLLVLLIFLYSAVFIQFPRVREAIILPGPIYLSNRGVAIPWGQPTETFAVFAAALGIGLALAVVIILAMRWYGRRAGRAPLALPWALLALVVAGIVGWLAPAAAPLSLTSPEQQGLRLAGGLQLSPEFMALLTGLSIYTSAFIADVVRAGIQSVGRGQVEAARSLGLNAGQSLRLVVFPQALRVIIPPLTSQYLNLVKNSSLAVAIGYPELFHVSGTVLNQSGRAVEVITIVMAVYLALSLATSALMNLYNRSVRLVER